LVLYMITWKTEKRKISELKPAPYNPRELTEQQAKDLSTSLERFNLADPIVINLNNRIIGGHQRINILKQSGNLSVDVRVPSRKLTDHEEKELNLRLNKNLGQWDYDMLANFDEDMLKDIGFDSKELDKIFQLETKTEDDDVPEGLTALVCDTCGKEYIKYKCQIREGQENYFCSKECYLKSHRNQKQVVCVSCGKEFSVRGYRTKDTKAFYCSRKCRKIGKDVKCDYCGKLSYRKPAEINDKNFCSRECMGKWNSDNLIGENHPSWLGGWEKYYGSNWTLQAKLARERDKGICQKCGVSEAKLGKSLDVHHKQPFREFGVENYKQANNLNNLISLCSSCHSSIEPRRAISEACKC